MIFIVGFNKICCISLDSQLGQTVSSRRWDITKIYVDLVYNTPRLISRHMSQKSNFCQIQKEIKNFFYLTHYSSYTINNYSQQAPITICNIIPYI
jgi:hypothetical protein